MRLAILDSGHGVGTKAQFALIRRIIGDGAAEALGIHPRPIEAAGASLCKDVPVHLLIDIVLGAVEAIVNPARLAELELSIKSGITAIISVILEGALTPEGRTKV